MIKIVDVAVVVVEMIEDDQRQYWGSRTQHEVPASAERWLGTKNLDSRSSKGLW